MLAGNKQNYHYSELPRPGAVGYLISKRDRYGTEHHYRGKQLYQVIAYPLCENLFPWAKGIHCAFFQSLKDHSVHKLSGFYFEEAT